MPRDASNLAVTVLGLAALIVVAGAIWFGIGASDGPPTAPALSATSQQSAETIRVHVSGAVAEPGVVELAADAIVADAVALAGGASASADLAAVNLAAGLRPGEHVVVPEVRSDAVGSAPADAGIDINTASVMELLELPGVGPVLAQRIVDHRTERGSFATVEDLLDVPGIGEAKLASMRDAIALP